MTGLILPRRQFLTGLAAALAAPAIVRIDSLMKLPRPEIVRAVSFQVGDLVTAGNPFDPEVIGIVQRVFYEASLMRRVVTMQTRNTHAIVNFDPLENPTFGRAKV
jgi:hypothetical protein